MFKISNLYISLFIHFTIDPEKLYSRNTILPTLLPIISAILHNSDNYLGPQTNFKDKYFELDDHTHNLQIFQILIHV
jgi:hypothetical protein